MMELRDGLGASDAEKAIRDVIVWFENLSGGGRDALALRDRYLTEVERAESQLSNLYPGLEWMGRLYSERYWRIRELHAGSPRPFPLIQDEARAVVGWLNDMKRWLEELAAEEALVDPKVPRVVLDTNAIMHAKPLRDSDWPGELGRSSVRLILPLIVITELDNLRNSGNDKKRARAATRLSEMRRLLDGKGRGPTDVRTRVTLEVLVTPRGHLRHQNNDEEILANVESLSRRPGGALVLATDDFSMQLRAESRGMDVVAIPENLEMPLQPPLPDES